MTSASEPAAPSSQPASQPPAPEPAWVRVLDAIATPYFALCKHIARALNRKRR